MVQAKTKDQTGLLLDAESGEVIHEPPTIVLPDDEKLRATELAFLDEILFDIMTIIGRKMLSNLRCSLDARAAEGSAAVFDCRADHLEGCAYELTGACKVWWSKPFKLNEG